MNFLFLAVGLALGAFISALFLKSQKSKLEAKNEILVTNLSKNEQELTEERERSTGFQSELTKQETINLNLQEKLENQKTEIEELQKRFTDAFKNLANEILEEKTKKFTEQNRSNLDELLNPLKEKIKDFENKVEQTNEKNRMSHTSLIEQIKGLKELNKKISDDAENLTKALKGDVKMQGNWGEVILERILEESGLRKGIEYEIQGRGMGLKSEEGTPSKPDFIIKFPDNKHIIIDSKVSLIAYERLINSESEEQKKGYRKELERSIKSHVDDLHDKNYQTREGLNTPDYVFLFMPIEASFTIALHPDSSLFKYAFDKKVIIIGPSGLMAILRTIESIWRQDNQTKHAMEIARQSGNLYDAFVRLLEDFEKVGSNIDRASNSYQDAVKKLSTGKGNLIARVENIKKLGAKTSKQIPEKFVQEINEQPLLEKEEERHFLE
ncbi:MAG: DNA recombination protein RmuC [Candidatus Cloacimonetes bacterium]|nr:DNA recombination protein RmuC [Candidatus Cloacimonadota bacterium]MBL7149868.1 DNA recombination protein RmuC [Candidatus Cloacimonadota bacterium]